jgi:glycosyltransferase involved in cell wall biosynthesis
MTDLRIAYVVNHAAFFVSHRLALALGAREQGFSVALFTGQAGSLAMEDAALVQLRAKEIPHNRTIFRSSGTNPFVELAGLIQLTWFLFRFKPDIVHCASPKGVLYGGIAARVCRVHGLVLAISGMGYAYTDNTQKTTKRAIIKKVYGALVRLAFGHRNLQVIVQNKDDYLSMQENGLAQRSNLCLIPGSGVDLRLFSKCDVTSKKKQVLLPARMLADKGVLEFVAAARSVKKLEPTWRFLLAGAAGYDNPTAISQNELQAWVAEGVVEWLGHVPDMVPLFQDAAIVCLPSYREGMPKALLEAAAAYCAIVTTDVTGCREAIEDGVTGDLVPVRNSEKLAESLLTLIRSKEIREGYGIKGQKRAVDLFSIQSVVHQTTDIYKRLISNA